MITASHLKSYPLTHPQKRIWYTQKICGNERMYNIGGYRIIKGNLDFNILEQTINLIIKNNDAFRLRFIENDEGVFQQVSDFENIKIRLYDFTKYTDAKREFDVWVKNTFEEKFSMEEDFLYHFAFFRISDEECGYFVKMHHIISDGWTFSILANQIRDIYAKIDKAEELNDIATPSYIDFIEAEQKYLISSRYLRDKEFWKEKFFDFSEESVTVIGSLESKRKNFTLDEHISHDIKQFISNNGISINTFFTAIMLLFINKTKHQEDAVLGIPILNRTSKKERQIIGMFTSTMPFRFKIDYKLKIEDFLKSVNLELKKGISHQKYPYDLLIKDLELKKRGYDGLFEFCVNYYNTNLYESFNGLPIESEELHSGFQDYKLQLIVKDWSEVDSFMLSFDYNTSSYSEKDIDRIYDWVGLLVKKVIDDPLSEIGNLELLDSKEKYKLIHEFNNTYSDYSKNKSIQQLFEEKVERQPNKIALVYEDRSFTYKELNEQANKLARVLRNSGVTRNTIVALLMERSPELIISIISVIKAGGAYLIIDSEWPKDRIDYILSDSGTNFLLIGQELKKSFNYSGTVINVFEEFKLAEESNNLEQLNKAEDLSYVIYTSGSTGKPKGVLVEHRNVVRLVNKISYVEFKEDDKILQTGSLAFDASTFEIWGALLNGLTLYLSNKENIMVADNLQKIISKYDISVLWLTAPLFNQLVDQKPEIFKCLRYLLIGGDKLSTKHVKLVRSNCPNLKLVNGYGPTENTTFSTTFLIETDFEDNIPIGKPINNSTAYIMDKNNNLLPIGISGELCVGGDGVARGYLNMPQLTEEKFIDNPFEAVGRLYKTGDLARWLPDGNIEFLGRMDQQVKIRGFRIELGEIEKQMLAYDEIKDVVVIDKEDDKGIKYLIAYFVAEEKLTISELRDYLKVIFPEYMIPSYFIQINKIPLTSNGKVDKKMLPEPLENMIIDTIYQKPVNEIEKKLLDIWKDVLGINQIGVNNNFFELGGHSLKASILISKIRKEFNTEVPMKVIFENPTIKSISKYIEKSAYSIYEEVKEASKKDYYEASASQKRMYMLQQLDLQSTGYNMPGIMTIAGDLDISRLEVAFNKLIKRHETLRTYFETIGEKIVQRIEKEIDFKIEYTESSDLMLEEVQKDFIKPFDLKKAPLLRVKLIKVEEFKHLLLIDMHHIISDGTSMGILRKELSMLYDEKELESLIIQYKDYSEWQNKLLNSKAMEKQKEYWESVLSGELPVLNIPTDYVRPIVQSSDGDCIDFVINKEITDNLKSISKDTDSTMHMILLSAVNILLAKYSGQEDIIIGCTTAGRTHADFEKVIGAFINTLPMRNYPKGDTNYNAFLKEVKENALKAYENQEYQFEEFTIRKDISRNPLFDVVFILQNMDSGKLELDDLIIEESIQEHKIAKVDLTFTAVEKQEEIIISLEYCTKLFKKETINVMIVHFLNILKSITKNRLVRLNEINMLSEKEKNVILYDFNDNFLEYPKNKTFQELFEKIVDNSPNDLAVVFEGRTLNYKELNEKSNKLARTLREKGVKPNDMVALMLDRSLEMIIGVMAIIKAGGAYLPIDPSYPEDRVQYMLDNSKTKFIISDENSRNKISSNCEILDIKLASSYHEDGSNLININTPADLIYVIYTSGTTGNPKGVMVEHRNLVNASYSWKKHYCLDELEVRLMQMASVAFDVFAGDLCRSLLNGGTMYICPNDIKLNMKALYNMISENKINIFESTPSLIIMFMDYIEENHLKVSDLKLLILGSDCCPMEEYRKLVKRYGNNIRIINSYGVTEATIDSSYYEERLENIPLISNAPIGKPLNNTKFYILNKSLQLQPIGIYGELYIGGTGVARGYLNQMELSKAKFIENPFSLGEKMYKTGDLARWLPDGNVEFLGRIDNQIKIRGFRVEIGEIENKILSNEKINEAVVVDREDRNGSKYLCAYITSDEEIEVRELKQYLAASLPEYMIPVFFIQLKTIPLTPNGKVDRKALPEPDLDDIIGEKYVAPVGEIEEKLAESFFQILGLDKVGVHDNFFDLGGHSLKAAVLAAKIHKSFNVEISLNEIFKAPTIYGIAKYIESTEKCKYEEIKPIEEKEYYEVSSAQKRMYILQRMDLQSTVYNIAQALKVEGKLDKKKLETTFQKIIDRHESLRTAFLIVDDRIVQKVEKNVHFNMEYFEADEKNIKEITKKFIKPFDLSRTPLLRVALVKLNEDNYILLFDIHHIVSDGVSIGILMKEFVSIYEGKEVGKLKIQHKDFAHWQNEMLKSEKIKVQEKYWLSKFGDKLPILNLPYDYDRSNDKNFEGNHVSLVIDKDTTLNLNRLAKETETTMYMILLSIFNIVLSKYSGQEDIIVGSPIAGRPHADLQEVIGMFVNTLAMRNYPSADKGYLDFLLEVKENSLKAYENSDYQLETLVNKIEIKRDISRNPLFDVMFTMQNMGYKYEDIKIDGLRFSYFNLEHNVSKFDLSLIVTSNNDEISMDFEYNNKLFKENTIVSFSNLFAFVIKQILNKSEIKLADIKLIDEEKIIEIRNQIDGYKSSIEKEFELEFNF